MPAIGFGAKVTGGDATIGTDAPRVFKVESGGEDDEKGLKKMLAQAAAQSPKPVQIVIETDVVVARSATPHRITSKNLTITGRSGSKIESNQLYFDCTQADNVILQNLTFEGTPGVDQPPNDAIIFDAENGRQPTGFWIDHCRFEAYRDLNITVHAKDVADVDGKQPAPLLITISNCYFHNDNPDAYRDIGAISIAGVRDDSVDENAAGNVRTNAYATVCYNMFETVRRRSPRSSGRCVVHAFDNVLELYGGTTGAAAQRNGMESGSNGILIAQANSFIAGTLPQTIKLSTTLNLEGTLTIDDSDSTLQNTYGGGAEPTGKVDPQVAINTDYTAQGISPIPVVQKMTRDLGRTIKTNAGPQYT